MKKSVSGRTPVVVYARRWSKRSAKSSTTSANASFAAWRSSTGRRRHAGSTRKNVYATYWPSTTAMLAPPHRRTDEGGLPGIDPRDRRDPQAVRTRRGRRLQLQRGRAAADGASRLRRDERSRHAVELSDVCAVEVAREPERPSRLGDRRVHGEAQPWARRDDAAARLFQRRPHSLEAGLR